MMSSLIERIKLRPKKKIHFFSYCPSAHWILEVNETLLSNLKEKIFSQEFYILINYQSGDHGKIIFRHALLGSYLTIQKQKEGDNSKKVNGLQERMHSREQ